MKDVNVRTLVKEAMDWYKGLNITCNKNEDTNGINLTTDYIYSQNSTDVILYKKNKTYIYINVLLNPSADEEKPYLLDGEKHKYIEQRGLLPISNYIFVKDENGLYKYKHINFFNLNDKLKINLLGTEIAEAITNFQDFIPKGIAPQIDDVGKICNLLSKPISFDSSVDFEGQIDSEFVNPPEMNDTRKGLINHNYPHLFHIEYNDVDDSYTLSGSNLTYYGDELNPNRFDVYNNDKLESERIYSYKKGSQQNFINQFEGFSDDSYKCLPESPKDARKFYDGLIKSEVIDNGKDKVTVLRFFKSHISYNKRVYEFFRFYLRKNDFLVAKQSKYKEGRFILARGAVEDYLLNEYREFDINFDDLSDTFLKYTSNLLKELVTQYNFRGGSFYNFMNNNVYEIIWKDEFLNSYINSGFCNENNEHIIGEYDYLVTILKGLSRFVNPNILRNPSNKKMIRSSKKDILLFNKYQLKKFEQLHQDILSFRYDFNEMFLDCFDLYFQIVSKITKYKISNMKSLSNEDTDKAFELLDNYLKFIGDMLYVYYDDKDFADDSEVGYLQKYLIQAIAINTKDILGQCHSISDANKLLYYIEDSFDESVLGSDDVYKFFTLKDVIRMIYDYNELNTDGRKINIVPNAKTSDELNFYHDILTGMINQLEGTEYYDSKLREYKDEYERLIPELKDYEYQSNNLSVIVPEDVYDIGAEGVILNHCVRTYVPSVAKGETKILFVRNNEKLSKPFYTLEIRDDKIRQCHGFSNSDVTPEVEEFLKEYCRVKNIKFLNTNRLLEA